MQLILTPPPKEIVILKEIYFNCGSPGHISFNIIYNINSGIARVIVSGGQSVSAKGASYFRGIQGHAPPENFEI